MLTSYLLVVAVMGVALPPAEACTYWCMNPVIRDYVCCDDGNPWFTEVEEPVVAEVGTVDAEVGNVDAEVETIDTKSPIADVDKTGSSGCIYYCAYNGQVYCCDNGENPREYFIPQQHVPQYIGPHGVKAIPPQYPQQHVPHGGKAIPSQYILRPGPGLNLANPFQNRVRGIEADIGDTTKDKPTFIGPQGVETFPPQYIIRPGPGFNSVNPFQNRVREIEADIGGIPKVKPAVVGPQGIETLPPGYIFSPVPSHSRIPGLNPIYPGVGNKNKGVFIGPQGVETLPSHYNRRPLPGYGSISDNSFTPYRHSFRGFNQDTVEETNEDDAFPFGRFVDHVWSSPTLGRLAFDSLMSMIPFEFPQERVETPKSLDESNLAKRQVLTMPTFDDVASLFFGNEEDDSIGKRKLGNADMETIDIPILSSVPLINSFAIASTLGENSKTNGVRLLPSNSNLFDNNLIPNRIPSNSVFFPIETLSSPSNSDNTKSLPNGVPLSALANPISGGVPLGLVDNTLKSQNSSISNTLSTKVPFSLLSSNNSFVNKNQSHQPNVLTTHKNNVNKGLPHSKGVPLPITQFQDNTVFVNVMQNVLQQPEIANAIMNHQLNSNHTRVIEEFLKNGTQLSMAVTENGLQIDDNQEVRKVLPDLSTIPIIEFEGNLNENVTEAPSIELDLAKDLTSPFPVSQLPRMKNPSVTDIHGKPPGNIAPQEQGEHVSIMHQQHPLHGRQPGQTVHGPSAIPYEQYPVLHNSHNKVYPLPGANQYRGPIRPHATHQAHSTYPKPTYNPSYPKLTYNSHFMKFSPDFIQTGGDAPGLPPTGLMPPSKDLKFFSHLPISISDNLVTPVNEYSPVSDSEKLVTDDVLDLVMNVNKATCLCLENGVRKTDASCPCSIQDLVVVFPPTPQQPYLLLPLSRSESFVEKFNSDKIKKELITSPSDYSIQKVSPENHRIKLSKERSDTFLKQEQQQFLGVLKRFHNLSNQIESRTLADILGNADKLPKVGIDNDQIEKVIDRESAQSTKSLPSQT